MLLAGGGDGSEEVKSGGVAGDRAHGVGLDGLDQAPELVVVEGALDIGGGNPRAGEDGDLLVGLETLDAGLVDGGGDTGDGAEGQHGRPVAISPVVEGVEQGSGRQKTFNIVLAGRVEIALEFSPAIRRHGRRKGGRLEQGPASLTELDCIYPE